MLEKVEATYSVPGLAKKFQEGNTKLVEELLFNEGLIDWRIARKMKEIASVFKTDALKISDKDIVSAVSREFIKTDEHMLWEDLSRPNIKLVQDTILRLKEYFKAAESNYETLEQVWGAIKSGRFDRDMFKLPGTVITGEDGGMYLLLNNLTPASKEIIESYVGKDYLSGKIAKKENGTEQITIGKGGFGTVRFGLSILDAKAMPGELICVKKTKNFEVLQAEAKGDIKPTAMERVINGTIGDYFTNDIAGLVHAPQVYDLSLVTDRDAGSSHQKGYFMMQIMPQNTATRIFKETKYQKWEYQKPYLMDVMEKTNKLLQQHLVAMTDLKPDNTLYDTDARKATIIDLGGAVKIENKSEISKFDIEKYYFEKTDKYAAAELNQEKGVIDISKALAYATGAIISEVIEKTDYANKAEIEKLAQSLKDEDVNRRLTIKEGIEKIKTIGGDYYANAIYTHYIGKLKDALKANKSSIGINEDIQVTESLFIPMEVTTLNPHKYKDLKTQNLFTGIAQ